MRGAASAGFKNLPNRQPTCGYSLWLPSCKQAALRIPNVQTDGRPFHLDPLPLIAKSPSHSVTQTEGWGSSGLILASFCEDSVTLKRKVDDNLAENPQCHWKAMPRLARATGRGVSAKRSSSSTALCAPIAHGFTAKIWEDALRGQAVRATVQTREQASDGWLAVVA